MTVRSKEYWNNKLVTGYQVTQVDWTDLIDTFISYTPTIQPGISGSTMNLDCNGSKYAIFEPRLVASGAIPINTNYTVTILNATDTLSINKIIQVTGTIIITMPSDVECSVEGAGTWDATAKTLTIEGITASVLEMNFIRYSTNSEWILKVSGFSILP